MPPRAERTECLARREWSEHEPDERYDDEHAAQRPTPLLATADQSMPELVRLRDGSHVTVRRVCDSDEPALRSFLVGLSEEARYLRFFTGVPDLNSATLLAVSTDPGFYGLVAHDETGVLVGHALYIQLDPTRAEVAVEVADQLHDRGLATVLIERLAAAAESCGITRFVAEVLPQNSSMLAVFHDGFDADVAFRDGTEVVEFPTSAWRTARERFPEHGQSTRTSP